MTEKINLHGDVLIRVGDFHDADIASQRRDVLGELSEQRVAELVRSCRKVTTFDLGAGRGAQTIRLLRRVQKRAIAFYKYDFTEEFFKKIRQVNHPHIFYL